MDMLIFTRINLVTDVISNDDISHFCEDYPTII